MSFMVQRCPLLCLRHKDIRWLLPWAGGISSLRWAAAAPGLSAEPWLTNEMLVGVGGIGTELFWASLEHKVKVKSKQEWQQY